MKKVNFVNLKKNYLPLKKEINQAIQKTIDQTAFVGGEELAKFEKEFSRFCQVRFAVGVECGFAALDLGLKGMGIEPGDEVITPANSFIASSLPISYSGAVPVLVDCDPESYNLNPKEIKKVIRKKTKAIMPVHLYGQPADMDEIREIAERYELLIIEDACQAHGASYQKKRVGSLGEVAAFSFFPSKNLGSFGNGGIVVTNNQKIAGRIRQMVNYGQKAKYFHQYLSWDRRLDNLQAAVLRVKLKHLNQWNRQRQKNARLYTQLLKPIKSVITPIEKENRSHVYHLYVARVKKRNKLQKYLASQGIYTGIHYPIPIHLQKVYKHLGYKKGDFPITEKYARQILSLPMFPELTENEIKYVVSKIADFYS